MDEPTKKRGLEYPAHRADTDDRGWGHCAHSPVTVSPSDKKLLQGAASALALILFIALPAVAQSHDDAVINGATSCREWSTLRASSNAAAAELWLSGVLLNWSTGKDGIRVDESTFTSSETWMDRFCQREPTSTIGKAASMLREELKRQRPHGQK